MNWLPPGPTPPDPAALVAFLADAGVADGEPVQLRWIGLDADSTQQIFELIRAGDKRGTFTLPWIIERTGSPAPKVGSLLVLVDMAGRPVLLTRVTRVDSAVFGKVEAQHTVIDGSPVRDPAVWKPLHTGYWNALLQPFGLAVSEDMPFWAERFVLLHDADAAQA